ncbi:hypothetical protein [Streptomyces hebeiensis]
MAAHRRGLSGARAAYDRQHLVYDRSYGPGRGGPGAWATDRARHARR